MKTSPLWLRMLPTPVVVNIATLGPVGRVKKGPGTVGTIAGLLWFTVFFIPSPFIAYLVLGTLSVYIAVLFCGEAENRMQKIDPPEVIIDEFVAVPFCFAGLHYLLWHGQAWLIILCGFVLFRLFDIVKPFGIARLQRLQGGIGVVADDIAAAFATCLCLHLIARFTPLFQ